MNTEILNKYIELINKGYCEDCNELNCIGNFPHKEIAKNIKVILEENLELKKQLEEYIRAEFKAKDELEKQRQEYQDVYKDVRIEIKSYKNQQKEFIEYLEDKLNMCDGFLDTIKSDLEELPYAGRIAGKTYITTQIMKNETSKKNYEEVLSKYKEIIGGDNK